MRFINIMKYRPGDAVENWDEGYVGMKVYYWGDKDKVLAEVKEVKRGWREGKKKVSEVIIEFSVKPNGPGVHTCCGKVPSGLGYIVAFCNLLLKAEETY